MSNDNINGDSRFRTIYLENRWNDKFSRSGTGSNLIQTRSVRRILLNHIDKYGIKSFLDIPCGDFFWMKEIQKELEGKIVSYTGADIVEEIIEANQKYSSSKFEFKALDILESDLPKSDLILTRDCLVHFSYKDIYRALMNIKRSQSTFFLTTTFPGRKNRNIETGAWRPVDLQSFPFFLPEPVSSEVEECTEVDSEYSDKSLALWEIKEIKLLKMKVMLLLLEGYYFILKSFRGFSGK